MKYVLREFCWGVGLSEISYATPVGFRGLPADDAEISANTSKSSNTTYTKNL